MRSWRLSHFGRDINGLYCLDFTVGSRGSAWFMGRYPVRVDRSEIIELIMADLRKYAEIYEKKTVEIRKNVQYVFYMIINIVNILTTICLLYRAHCPGPLEWVHDFGNLLSIVCPLNRVVLCFVKTKWYFGCQRILRFSGMTRHIEKFCNNRRSFVSCADIKIGTQPLVSSL